MQFSRINIPKSHVQANGNENDPQEDCEHLIM